MLAIRLSRIGTKNKPLYRLIISEKGRDLYGKPLEILGSYNPHSKDLTVKGDRVKYWLGQGAQMSPTVNNLLIDKKIIEGKKATASKRGEEKAKQEEKPAITETPKIA
jgi:small subunit ribosomal protein S16